MDESVYAELHCHSAYSFLDGASLPEELVTRAAPLGYRALALTDHDNLHGALEFAQLAHAAGIQPITGAEITLADSSHLTLLAESSKGYGNLCRLLSHIHHGRHPAPAIRPDEDAVGSFDRALSLSLGDYADGLILLTGCRQGQLSQLVDAGDRAGATAALRQYIDWFDRDRVVVEVQHNDAFGDTKRVRALVDLANAVGLRYAATGDVHYHRRDRHRLQDVLVAIKHRTTLDGCHRKRRPNGEFYLRSPEAMHRVFAHEPEAIHTTALIAERCATFDITRNLRYTFPDYDPGTGETPDDMLARICWESFPTHYSPDNEKAKEKVRDELQLIARHNLAGFFLIYHDLLELAREVAAELRGSPASNSRRALPPGRGRGSAVSSVVCYLIGLSPVDPLKHDLYVGRFLNDELSSIPDIDLDFPREIRERLIERVYEVYGAEHAALVCAFSTYRLRSAVRDVGKALGLPLADLDRIARLSEPRSADGLADELMRLPEYAARLHTPPWSHLVELSRQLAGFPRHVTQHVGGMIISATPLTEVVPIQPAAMAGRYICHWDKDSCEDAGFVKIDFLSLGMLSLVEEALDLIEANGGDPVDLSQINFNDPAIYQMIQDGDTIGVFQIESRAQIQMLRRTKPHDLKDIVVQVAIVRPGPIVGGAVTPYVQHREQSGYEPEYDHPRLEPILHETLGVILYQEQVVRVAEELAGFTAGRADQLRRAMTRKRSAEAMEDLRDAFIQGCLDQGDVTLDTAKHVFAKLAGFAAYGFPKSHAAAFALLAYQSCWLKQRYPAEFLCALLNNQPMGFYAPHVLVNDAKRHGLSVLRADINKSAVRCSVEGKRTVRIGLAFVKGLGEDAARAIVREREIHGPYRSLADLMRRVPLRPESMRQLIGADACYCFGMQRREMIWLAGLFIPSRTFANGGGHKTPGRQLSLALPTKQDAVALPPTSAWERMADEYRILGLSTQHHPMALLRSRFPKWMTSTRNLSSLEDGVSIHLPGLIVCRQRPGTAKGITFLLLEDEFGLVNVVVYPSLYDRQRQHVRATPLLIVHGRLQKTSDTLNVVARYLQPIENVPLIAPSDDGDTRQHPLDGMSEDANPTHIQIVQLSDQPNERFLQPPDLQALRPAAHNYR